LEEVRGRGEELKSALKYPTIPHKYPKFLIPFANIFHYEADLCAVTTITLNNGVLWILVTAEDVRKTIRQE